MSTAVYFIVSEIFAPFFLNVGAQMHKATGLKPAYFAFLPRDNRRLRQLHGDVFPRDVYSLDQVKINTSLFSVEEADQMLGFMMAKHGGDVTDWRARLYSTASYIEHYLDANDVRLIVLWNGQDFVGRIFSLLGARRGIKTVFFENGYFPRTLQCDPCGVNSASSLSSVPFSEIRAVPKAEPSTADEPDLEMISFPPISRLDVWLSGLKKSLAPKYLKSFPEQRGSDWRVVRQLQRARQAVPMDQPDLPEHFVFVPLQVHDDTQVLLNCRHFDSVETFFHEAYKAIRAALPPGYPIVVKEHPEDLCRHDYDAIRQAYPDVIWLKKFNIDTLLERASMVVVINSSVGLQAIARKLPTVVFGESFYTRDEIAFVVHDLAQAAEVVARAAQGLSGAMLADIDHFVAYLRNVHFIQGGWASPLPGTIVQTVRRLAWLAKSSPRQTPLVMPSA